MAGEGLFFTGVVLKNNRNILEEENARERLALQEEALNMRKQESADRRRANRQAGIKSSSVDADYSGISDPRLKSEITKRASDFNRFVAGNYNNEDPLVQSAIQDRRDEVRLFTEYAKSLDSKLSIYDPLNPNAANLRYQMDADGNNMIDVNKNRIFQELSDGTFDLASSIASFENDFDGQVIQDETTPGYKAILKGYETNYMVGDNTYKGIPPNKKEEFIESFTKNHLINDNTRTFSSTQAEKDYMTNEKFEINGTVYDGIGAYLLEKEGFTDTPKKEERLRFDPNSKEFFNEKDHVKYVNYLAEKIWSRDTSNPVLVRKGKPTGTQEGLSQEDISRLTSPREVKEYGLAKIRFGSGQYEGLIEEDISVPLSPESLIKEQGEEALERFKNLYQSYNYSMTGDAGSTDVTAEGKVIYTSTLVSTGEPVAVVEFSGQSFLIPLDVAESSIKKKVKASNAITMDLFRLGEYSTTQPQGDSWKTTWKQKD